MDYRQLGRTQLSVSPICIGAWQLSGPVFFDGQPDGHPDPGRENVLRLIRQLGDEGINCIDTAEQYGNAESERRVGEALQGHRDVWVISTKFGYRVGPNNQREDDSSAPTIMPSLEGSLRRLRTDYIDVYLYHCPPALDDLVNGRAVLELARQQGKIRYYGISTNNLALLQAMQERDMLDVVQYASNILQPASEIRELLLAHDIGAQVRGVMAQGRLSGKYFAGAPVWREDDNRSNRFKDHDYSRYAVFASAVPEGYTMAQVAIRWALDQPGNHTICMGAKNLEDYRTAIKAAEMPPLDTEILSKLMEAQEALK